MSELYRIKLMGVAPGFNKKQVAMFATGLFKVSQEKTEAMLDKPCTIKKNADKRQALAMKKKLEGYGMFAVITSMDSDTLPQSNTAIKSGTTQQQSQPLTSQSSSTPSKHSNDN